MEEYIISIFAGAIYGIGIGFLKYITLWKKMLNAPEETKFKSSAVTLRMIISYTVNIVTLLLVYFLRNVIPLDFTFVIIAAAIGLSLSGKIYSIHKTYGKVSD